MVNLPQRVAFFALDRSDKLVPILDDLSPAEIGSNRIDPMDELGKPEMDGIVLQGRTESRRLVLRGSDPTRLARAYRDFMSLCRNNCEPKTSEVTYVHKFGPLDTFTATHDYESCTGAAHPEPAESLRRTFYDTAIDDAYAAMVKEGDIPSGK